MHGAFRGQHSAISLKRWEEALSEIGYPLSGERQDTGCGLHVARCQSKPIQIEIAIEIGIEKTGSPGIDFDTDEIVFARRRSIIQ